VVSVSEQLNYCYNVGMSEKRVKERGKEKYERDSEKIIKEGGRWA
jgi:hypothetical protein